MCLPPCQTTVETLHSCVGKQAGLHYINLVKVMQYENKSYQEQSITSLNALVISFELRECMEVLCSVIKILTISLLGFGEMIIGQVIM